MSDPDTTKLTAILAEISDMQDAGKDAAAVIAALQADHGATYKTAPTTNTLRCAGVTGSCTWSETTGVLSSWRANAQKRVTPGHGHNSRRAAAGVTDDRLRLLVERIERLEEEKKGIADDIRDVYGEAKAIGYDARIMRQIVKLRKMKPDDRAEMEAILDTYKAALGLG